MFLSIKVLYISKTHDFFREIFNGFGESVGVWDTWIVVTHFEFDNFFTFENASQNWKLIKNFVGLAQEF